jgi:hypothetical protein
LVSREGQRHSETDRQHGAGVMEESDGGAVFACWHVDYQDQHLAALHNQSYS